MLRIDLMWLESPERFQLLCSRLIKRKYPGSVSLRFSSWDGGRDIYRTMYTEKDGTIHHDIVWQVKFTKSLNAATKKSIRDSINSIRERASIKIDKWILCLPRDPTGSFMDWLVKNIPEDWTWEVWGEQEICDLLEENVDIVESFFYPIHEELRKFFISGHLELERFLLDPECEWKQTDPNVLHFAIKNNVQSPDLIFDIIVRNTGSSDALLFSLQVDFVDWENKMHGMPGEGLLFPQITYKVSINYGNPGRYIAECEPPLIIKANSVERFKICLCDTGYAWRGTVLVGLNYGKDKQLGLPAIRLYT